MPDSTALFCTLITRRTASSPLFGASHCCFPSCRLNSIADGLRLEFNSAEGLRSLVEEFIVLEQECCSFLTFTLSTPSQDLSLMIEGPPEAAAMWNQAAFLESIAATVTLALTFDAVINISTIKSMAMRMPIPCTGNPREM